MNHLHTAITDLINKAEKMGFKSRREDGSIDHEAKLLHHEMILRFWKADDEFKRLVATPIETKYNQYEISVYWEARIDHNKQKAEAYLRRHIDEIHTKHTGNGNYPHVKEGEK